MKIFLFYFEMAIKITGSAQIIGSVGLAETHLFFRPNRDHIRITALERSVMNYWGLKLVLQAQPHPP